MTIQNPEKIVHWAEDKAGLMRDMNADELEAIILRGVAAVISPCHMQLVELQYLVSACKTVENKMIEAGFTIPQRESVNFTDDVEAKLKRYMDINSSSEYEQNILMLSLAKLLEELHILQHAVQHSWQGFFWLREVAARALLANYYQDKENGTYDEP